MKRFSLILMAALFAGILFQSCEDDQSSLADPRDAIAKSWRVSDNGSPNVYYDVVITKDATDITKVWLQGFHNYGDAKIYGTLAGSVITIPQQDASTGEYNVNGEGTIISAEKLTFEYTLDEGDGPVDYAAEFGEQVAVKKKVLQ